MDNNLIVHYMYRDAGNYKRHGSVIVKNEDGMTPGEFYMAIKSAFEYMKLFPDIVTFDPDVMGWPTLFFENHNLAMDDVGCHELISVQSTDEVPTQGFSVGDLLKKLMK